MSSSVLSTLRSVSTNDPAAGARRSQVVVLSLAMAEVLGADDDALRSLGLAAATDPDASADPLLVFARSLADTGQPPTDASPAHLDAYERVRNLIQPVPR